MKISQAGIRVYTFIGLFSLISMPVVFAANVIKIAAIGDSITAGVEIYSGAANGCTGCRSRSYPGRLENKLDSNNIPSTIYNYGIPGESSAAGASRVGGVIAATNADYVIFHEGTNSLLFTSPATVASDVGIALSNILSNGKIPIATTIIPDTRGPNENWKGIPSANVGIRQRAIDNDIILVDFYNALPNPFSSWNAYLTGGLHPNDSGYQLMADKLFSPFEELLKRSVVIPPLIMLLLLED